MKKLHNHHFSIFFTSAKKRKKRERKATQHNTTQHTTPHHTLHPKPPTTSYIFNFHQTNLLTRETHETYHFVNKQSKVEN